MTSLCSSTWKHGARVSDRRSLAIAAKVELQDFNPKPNEG